MKKLIAIIALSLLAVAFKPQAASAECTQIYGGGQTCSYNFSIEKMVQKPGKGGGNYVSNLSINDPRYSPNQNVNFKIVVKNTGSNTIPNLQVVDVLPQYVTFVSGPGSYDSNSKTITFNVSNFAAGQSATYTLVGKIANSNTMPTDQGVFCLLNQVTGTDTNGAQNSTSSQFCIQKPVVTTVPQVLPAPKVVKTPATGPEMLPLIALLPAAFGGFILRRKSSKTNKIGGEK